MAGHTRKRRTREHVIGDLGVNFVERQFILAGHAVNRTSSGQDYGVDLAVLTFDSNGELQNGQIEVQVRSSEQVQSVNKQTEISCRLATSHVTHWLLQPNPIIVAIYDAESDRAWWVNVQRAAECQDLDDGGETITVRIPFS